MEYYTKLVINGTEYPLENVIVGSGAPTSATPANVGQLYANMSSDFELYICTNETSVGATSWLKVVQRVTETEISSIINPLS